MVATPQPSTLTSDETPLDCTWTDDLRSSGLSTSVTAIDRGVPLLALGSLVATGIVALAFPDTGESPTPVALLLLLVASLPWLRWLWRGDEGPTWQFMVVALGPLAALGVGQWFVPAISLHSLTAYPLLAFPSLLLVIISVAAISRREAIWTSIGGYIAFGGPLLAAGLFDRDVSAIGIVIWQVGFVLALIAGYAARLGYQANRLVAATQAELALQQAAEERRQVARDVHDVVAHTLAVTMLHITAARMAVVRDEPAVAITALEEAERQGRASLTDIRSIVRLLRSDTAGGPDTVQPGLADIDHLVAGYQTAGLPVTLAVEPSGLHGSPASELALFRVLQEALTNAARHGTGPATVDLRETAQGIRLEVSNPAPGGIQRRSRGSGLIGMQERMTAAAGTFDAGLQRDQWVIRATVPTGPTS